MREVFRQSLHTRLRNEPVTLRVRCKRDPLKEFGVELRVHGIKVLVESILVFLVEPVHMHGLSVEDVVLISTVVEFELDVQIRALDGIRNQDWVDSGEEQNRSEDQDDQAESEAETNEEFLPGFSRREFGSFPPHVALVLVEVDVVESIIQAEPLEQVETRARHCPVNDDLHFPQERNGLVNAE